MKWRRFIIDDGDGHFPRIVEVSPDHDEGRMFAECKIELLETMRHRRDHWAARIRELRSLRVEHVLKGGTQ